MRFASLSTLLLACCLLLPLSARGDGPVFTQDDYLSIVRVPNSNRFLAYSKTGGSWQKHTFAADIKAEHILSGSVCAFQLSGPKVAEVVAVDRSGNWRTLKLPAPTTQKCQPVVDREVACYSIEGHVHAFSALTGTWDTLPTKGSPTVNGDTVTVVTADSVAIFSAQTGKWAVASLTDERE